MQHITKPLRVIGSPALRTARKWPRWLQAALVVTIALVVLSTSLSSAEAERTTSRPTSTTTLASTSTTSSPSTLATPAVPPAIDPVPSIRSTKPELAALRIGEPHRDTRYRRDLFPTWLDLDGNGCNARDDVLTQESTIAVTRKRCDAIYGSWSSIYDGVTVTSAAALDIDHLVPLADAWRSGAWTWNADRRVHFANDTRYPDHLIAVTRASNRAKGDKPPNQWRPPDKRSWCRYATAWVEIKVTWELTATNAERDALGQMLETC